MQSETADYSPGNAAWRSLRNNVWRLTGAARWRHPVFQVANWIKHTRRLWFRSIPSIIWRVETWRHPQNRKYITYRIAVRGGPSLIQHVQKIGDTWTCGFWDMQADRQTYRHTDMLITIFGNLTRGEVMTGLKLSLFVKRVWKQCLL